MVTSAGSPAHRDTTAISCWATASPYGLGASAFRAGLMTKQAAVRPLPEELRAGGPHEEGGWVPDFDIKAVLGRKGTRSMDRLTALTVATVGMLLRSAGPGLAEDHPEAMGLVIGSGHGSVKSIMDFTKESMTSALPYHVDPGSVPNTVMNRAASQSAISHSIKGPNVTVSAGVLTGLIALNYATALLRQRRAEAVLVGASEEYSAQRSWLAQRADAGDGQQTSGPLGEGSVLLLLEPASRAVAYGRPVLAEVVASRFTAFTEPEGAQRSLARSVTGALQEARASPDQVTLVVPSDRGGYLGDYENAALSAVLSDHRPQLVLTRALIGDMSAAAAAFQLAAALVHANTGGLALVTSVDPGGNAGCTLLRLPAASS
ncbi:beta-ketoacyl synthase N-terminal-like domain-containing protein [Streptomyces shenzhenensis]|uniref:beta-ketoacyl synthase N-terminal-like domain-containing protein n=1 Tax=Streptomyces shenzhenensis TaxID=943815 RepID=UPI001F16A894|nr:beta-ketoacyl synthase N-terminal-like domain-containing protein [Streptomyces shenzhenensis]